MMDWVERVNVTVCLFVANNMQHKFGRVRECMHLILGAWKQ